MSAPLTVASRLHVSLRERLLVMFPELADDDRALMDTLEGESPLPDVLAAVIRSARIDKANADALSTMIEEMAARHQRLDARAAAKRASALHAMQEAGLQKLEMPDFTVSVRTGPDKLIGDADPAALPDHLCKISRTASRSAIKDALKAGQAVEGYSLSNGEPTLSIRTK